MSIAIHRGINGYSFGWPIIGIGLHFQRFAQRTYSFYDTNEVNIAQCTQFKARRRAKHLKPKLKNKKIRTIQQNTR